MARPGRALRGGDLVYTTGVTNGAARRIGILGGTFDPIHRGHLDVVEAAQAALALTRIVIVPSHVPPHRPQPVASGFHRFAMVAIAIGGRRGWSVSDMELRSPPPSYTSATLARFHTRGHAPGELFFLVGADAFVDIGTWKDYPHILDRAHFVVVSRPACRVEMLPERLPALQGRMRLPPFTAEALAEPAIILIDAATADVSSTAIRLRRAQGQSIAGMVGGGVQQHIEQHGLYTSMFSGRRASDRHTPAPAAGRLHGQD
jgi:nicotinate-nucleotide adenylyltransferase